MDNTLQKQTNNKLRQKNRLHTCFYFGILDCTCCKVDKNNKSSFFCKQNKISDCTTKNEPSASSSESTDSNISSSIPLEELRNEPGTSTSQEPVIDSVKSAEKSINFGREEPEMTKFSSADLRSEIDREEEEIDVVNGSLEDINIFQMTENRAKTIDNSEQASYQIEINLDSHVLEHFQEEIDVVGLNDIPSVSTTKSVKRKQQEQTENEPEEEIDVVNLPISEQIENITTTAHPTPKPKRKKLSSNSNMGSNEDEVIDVVNLIDDTPPNSTALSNALVNNNRQLRSHRKERNHPDVIDLMNTTVIEISDSPVAPRVLSGVISIEDDETPKKIGPSWGNCPICFEDLSKCEIMSTMCGHVFCASCIKTVIKTAKKCPKCRKNLTLKMVHPLFF